jgi:myo-inositol 2-dehydrogenase / D-chiro-inositol 1-dehydrogenase
MTLQKSGPLRVGLVGCGYATTQCHLPALARISEAEAVALADVDERVLKSVAERWGVSRLYGSASDLASDPSVDVVAVCVPPALHAEVSLGALESGKHVFIEKPLATSLSEADLIARRVAASQQVAVGFNLRCHALIDQARVLLQSGALGRVHAIRTTFTDPPRKGDSLPAWRRSRALGGGALADKAVHHFDLWRFLLEDEVDQVHSFVGGDDETVVVSARMCGGALASVIVSPSRVRNDVTVFGDKGELDISLYRFDGVTFSAPGEIPGAPRARVRRAGTALAQLAGGVGALRGGGYFALSYGEQWRRFAQAIQEGTPPAAGIHDGREALLITLAALRAADDGRAVSVDDVRLVSSTEPEPVGA